MTFFLDPAKLVRTARRKAGLSQRAMAERAGTCQSVVARIETGVTDPSSETLRRLITAAALEVRCDLMPLVSADSHMLQDVARILSMTPEDRLTEVRNVSRMVAAALPLEGGNV